MLRASKVREFSGHRDSVYTLLEGFEPGTFFSAGADGFIVQWTLGNDDGVLHAKTTVPVYALSKNGRTLLAGTRDGVLHIFSDPVKTIQAHEGGIFDIAVITLNGETLIVTASADGYVKLWDHELRLRSAVQLSGKSIRSLCWHESSQTIIAGSSDTDIYFLHLPALQFEAVKGHTHSVFSLALNKAQNMLLSGGRDAVIRPWELIENKPEALSPVNAHWYPINHILYNPSGRFFASCSLDKSIKIWDSESMELLKVIDKERNQAHSSSVNKLLWLDDSTLISCSDDRKIMQFQLADRLM